MTFFSPWFPALRDEPSLLDEHPFFHFGSTAFRDAVNASRTRYRANVSETDQEYRLEIEVPGYRKPEISLEYGEDGKALIVSGRKEQSFEQRDPTAEDVDAPKPVTVEDAPEETGTSAAEAPSSTAVTEANTERTVGTPAQPKYWVSERSVGTFQRTFSLPPGLDLAKASASLDHGVLTVVIPKAPKQSVRSIQIS